MRKFLRNWVFNVMSSDMKKQLILVIVSILIIIVSYFTGEFQSVREYLTPPAALAFLCVIPIYLFISLFRCGLDYSRKFYALEEQHHDLEESLNEILHGRKSRDILVLKLSDLYEKYKSEKTIEAANSLMDDGLKYIRESGVMPEATIYWFENQRNSILYPDKAEEIMNKLISELRWK